MPSIIVTGAAGGIGSSICRVLASSGYRVGALDSDESGTRHLADTLPDTVALGADITDSEAVAAAIAGFGTPDALVNNAGIVRFGALLDHTPEDFLTVLRVNVLGTFVTSRAVAQRWVAEARPGAIVNITSINGIVSSPNTGSYGPSKAGIGALTMEMALEWGPHGIRVNAVAPGLVEGGMSAAIHADQDVRARREAMIPLRRLCREDDVARAVRWLVSEDAAYLTGQTVVVDGGLAGAVLTQVPRPASVDGVGIALVPALHADQAKKGKVDQ